jgi:hypothetical protein
MAGCRTQIGFTCTGTDTFHICSTGSDCAGDPGNTNCCDVQGQWVCVSNQIRMAGLTCK